MDENTNTQEVPQEVQEPKLTDYQKQLLAMPECALSLHQVMWMPGGGWASLTARGVDVKEVTGRMSDLVAYYLNNGYSLDKADSVQAASPPPSGPTPQPPTAPVQSPPQPQSARQSSGVADLNMISVVADQRGTHVEFFCEGMQWPIKDHRPAEVVVGIFDQALGWNADMLKNPAAYKKGEQINGYKLQWEDVERDGRKFRNALRIFAG